MVIGPPRGYTAQFVCLPPRAPVLHACCCQSSALKWKLWRPQRTAHGFATEVGEGLAKLILARNSWGRHQIILNKLQCTVQLTAGYCGVMKLIFRLITPVPPFSMEYRCRRRYTTSITVLFIHMTFRYYEHRFIIKNLDNSVLMMFSTPRIDKTALGAA